MKNIKKISIFILVILLVSTSTVTSFAQNDLDIIKRKDAEVDAKIVKLEKEIDEMEMVVFGKLKHSLEKVESMDAKSLHSTTGFEDMASYTDYLFEKHNKEASLNEREILLKYGFKPVSRNEDSENSINPSSVSADMTFSEEPIYYDSSAGLYRYTSDWLWREFSWDELADINDLVGVGITKPGDYLIYSSFAKTWDNLGNQTGYVDNSGNHTPSNSYITKRFEDNNGVCFNVNDTPSVNGQVGITRYHTHKGRVTVYLKKLGSTTTKVIMSYNHNYKIGSLQPAAKISNVGFTSLSGLLSVTYQTVNKEWQRSAGGKIIN